MNDRYSATCEPWAQLYPLPLSAASTIVWKSEQRWAIHASQDLWSPRIWTNEAHGKLLHLILDTSPPAVSVMRGYMQLGNIVTCYFSRKVPFLIKFNTLSDDVALSLFSLAMSSMLVCAAMRISPLAFKFPGILLTSLGCILSKVSLMISNETLLLEVDFCSSYSNCPGLVGLSTRPHQLPSWGSCRAWHNKLQELSWYEQFTSWM